MPTPPFVFLSDYKRNAHKYDLLLRALRRTNEIIRKNETAPDISTSVILAELLPQFVAAIEAERGFVARRALQKNYGAPFETVLIHPAAGSLPDIASSPVLEQMAQDGNARILAGQEADGIIGELRALRAHSAVLATFRGIDHVYLVGLCDKKESDAYPFLAADRVVLENLLSLMAIGLRAVERRQQELHLIQEISERVAQGGAAESQGADVWQIIARGATTLSATQFAGVYALDERSNRLTPHCTWDAISAQPIGYGLALSLDDASLNSAVARTKSSRYVADVAQAAGSFPLTTVEQNVRSAYCVPLISQQRLVGTLYVASTQFDGISIDQRDAIDRLAPHAAIALQNALLLQQQLAAIRLDEDTIRVQHAIADILQVTNQAEQIQEVLREYFPSNVDFFIATYDAETGEISLPIVYERGARIQDTSQHPLYCPRKSGVRKGLIDYMIAHNVPVLAVDDLDAWEQREEIEDVYRKDVKCCLLVELKHDGRLLGWTGFRGFGQPFLFDSKHRALLAKITPHIAIVLHNARLYGQRLRELEVVSRFQTRITALSPTEQAEIEDISYKVVDALKELGMHIGDMYMILFDHADEMLRTPMAYEDGRLLGITEIESKANYRTRKFSERNGLVEWILTHGEPILARNRQEIDNWIQRGVTDLPERAYCWLGVPMKVRGEVVGVMVLRSFCQEDQFSEAYIPLFQTIASQAAITIDNARMYQLSLREATQMDALYHAGRAIAAAGVDLESVLHSILQQATLVTRCHLGAIYLNQTDHLKLVAAWPRERFAILQGRFSRINTDRRSIMVRALHENQAQLVTDVRSDPDYLDISEGKTRSELAVVLRREGARFADPLGIINVEHQEVGGLTESDRQILILLSNLAVVAIQNAEKAQDLSRILTIAVMGAWGADVIHDVKQEISTIRWAVDSLRNRSDLDETVLSELAEIDEAAARMRVPDIPTEARKLESVGDFADTPLLDEVLADEARLFEQQTGIRVETLWGCHGVSVRIQDEWLRRLVRHYLKNAQKHMMDTRRVVIYLTTTVEDGKGIVFVKDTGRGVRPDIRSQLFGAEISHDGRPPGRGLLLVRLIAEAHGGRAWLAWSEANQGSCFAFSVPIVQ
jgi:GAF domain-containing protein